LLKFKPNDLRLFEDPTYLHNCLAMWYFYSHESSIAYVIKIFFWPA
jgi:hypothetical protein